MTSSLRIITERAKERGEVAASIDSCIITTSILGPLFYRRWFSRQRIDADFRSIVLANVLRYALMQYCKAPKQEGTSSWDGSRSSD